MEDDSSRAAEKDKQASRQGVEEDLTLFVAPSRSDLKNITVPWK